MAGSSVVPASPLEALEHALSDLKDFADEVPRELFESDRRTFYMVRDAMILASQAAVDLALGLCRHHALGLAVEYREAFRLLGEAGLIDRSLADQLQGWAGMRNVLIHLYTRLDLGQVHHARTEGLEPLEAFLKAAATLHRELPEER